MQPVLTLRSHNGESISMNKSGRSEPQSRSKQQRVEADPYGLARDARKQSLLPFQVPLRLHENDSHLTAEGKPPHQGDLLERGYIFDPTKFGVDSYDEVESLLICRSRGRCLQPMLSLVPEPFPRGERKLVKRTTPSLDSTARRSPEIWYQLPARLPTLFEPHLLTANHCKTPSLLSATNLVQGLLSPGLQSTKPHQTQPARRHASCVSAATAYRSFELALSVW